LLFGLADLSVLSIQQTGTCPAVLFDEADIVIKDINEIVGIVEKMEKNFN